LLVKPNLIFGPGKKKTLCVPREPQKVLVVELFCSSRRAEYSTSSTVLTAHRTIKEATYSPFVGG
jgi:hypothetical protein